MQIVFRLSDRNIRKDRKRQEAPGQVSSQTHAPTERQAELAVETCLEKTRCNLFDKLSLAEESTAKEDTHIFYGGFLTVEI